MSEKIPTPSTEFSEASTRQDIFEGIPAGEERRYNILEAQEAAYAAKPFMDVAVELYEAQEYKEFALDNTNLNTLVDYAERRARHAVEKGEVRELSGDEQNILAIYKAQAGVDKVKLELGDTYDNITPEDITSATVEAQDRFNVSSVREERSGLKRMEYKLDRYASYLKTGDDSSEKEFSTTTDHAAGLLGRMDVRTGKTTEWDGKPVDETKLRLEDHNLRTEADMLKFVGSNIQLQKQKEQIARISIRRRSVEAKQEVEISVPDDPRERRQYVKEYFAEHDDVKDPENAAVLKEFILKETQFRVNEVKKLNRPGVKTDDRAATIFRLGAFTNSTLEELAPELRFTYKLMADKQPGLSYSDFDSMSIEDIAKNLGVDVHKDIDGYDQYVKKGQRQRLLFPNIDR
jgi:hypothetical protein